MLGGGGADVDESRAGGRQDSQQEDRQWDELEGDEEEKEQRERPDPLINGRGEIFGRRPQPIYDCSHSQDEQ